MNNDSIVWDSDLQRGIEFWVTTASETPPHGHTPHRPTGAPTLTTNAAVVVDKPSGSETTTTATIVSSHHAGHGISARANAESDTNIDVDVGLRNTHTNALRPDTLLHTHEYPIGNPVEQGTVKSSTTSTTPRHAYDPADDGGGVFATIMRQYADVTGHAPLLPEYALGFWQSKCRYRTSDELVAVVDGYAQRNVSVAVIVIDYYTWTKFGDFQFDTRCWPNVSDVTRLVAPAKVLRSTYPWMDPTSTNYKESVAQQVRMGNRGVSGHSMTTPLQPHPFLVRPKAAPLTVSVRPTSDQWDLPLGLWDASVVCRSGVVVASMLSQFKQQTSRVSS